MMVRERGSGVTPPRVVELLKEAVDKKSMLAVSKETGLGLAAIGRYLKGIGEPTTATLEKLALYFKRSVPWLRGESRYAPLTRDDDGKRIRSLYRELPNFDKENKSKEMARLRDEIKCKIDLVDDPDELYLIWLKTLNFTDGVDE
jgi:transcriptional regulator with XRE-family HTH domain